MGIVHLNSAAYHLNDNILAKLTIRTLKQCMERIAGVDLTLWTKYMGLTVIVYWKFPHESTGFSLFASYMGEKHAPPPR